MQLFRRRPDVYNRIVPKAGDTKGVESPVKDAKGAEGAAGAEGTESTVPLDGGNILHMCLM